MTWLSLIMNIVTIITVLMKGAEKNKIIAETEMIERAKALNEINRRLVEASRIPAELAGLTDEELDAHVESKGWFRD